MKGDSRIKYAAPLLCKRIKVKSESCSTPGIFLFWKLAAKCVAARQLIIRSGAKFSDILGTFEYFIAFREIRGAGQIAGPA